MTTFLGLLQALPIGLDDETAGRAWDDSIHLARTHQLSAYDAAYLELGCGTACLWPRWTRN